MMIAQLRGTLAAKSALEAVIDCGGVGYAVFVSSLTSEKLPPVGEQATLLTTLVVREDAMQLFGFSSEAEREAFRLLVAISGIGPKTALSILSAITLAELQSAVLGGDVLRLQKLPGVGKKTAERILVELRDKIGALAGAELEADQTLQTATQREVRDETLAAMVKLGYPRAAAQKAIRQALAAEPETQFSAEQLLRKALRHIAR